MKISMHEPGGAVLALKANSCKWPIGEPQLPDFHFCCRPALEGEVYCRDHCAIAYPATGRRQPGRKAERERKSA